MSLISQKYLGVVGRNTICSSAGCFDTQLSVHCLEETFIEKKHLPVGQETVQEGISSIGTEQDVGTGTKEAQGEEQAGSQAPQGDLSQRQILLGFTNQGEGEGQH